MLNRLSMFILNMVREIIIVLLNIKIIMIKSKNIIAFL